VDYLAHILEVGHESVLEHGSVTVYLQGVSRSLTHELVRHRHFSYSQLSQRYVDETAREEEPVIPPIFETDTYARGMIGDVWRHSHDVYDELVARAVYLGANRKQAREAARAVLPNCTETKIVVTGNYRAWRHFFGMRGSLHADAEIRMLAVKIFGMIQQSGCGNVFQDMEQATDLTNGPRDFLRWVEKDNGGS
jgi:thymidylate synthase (FAD)